MIEFIVIPINQPSNLSFGLLHHCFNKENILIIQEMSLMEFLLSYTQAYDPRCKQYWCQGLHLKDSGLILKENLQVRASGLPRG